MRLKEMFVVFFVVASLGNQAQLRVDEVVQKIQKLQAGKHDPFYDPGLFPSQRDWSLSREAVDDNTIFFTASIVGILQDLRPSLSAENKRIVDDIAGRAKPNYARYKSRNGEPTYNFWQTVPPDLPFPNGPRIISNSLLRLPDDFDTSVLIALARQNPDYSDSLKSKMAEYSIREYRDETELETLKKYEARKAYEVWFGKDMPQTFDLCVMSNVMRFVFENEMELNRHDEETLSLIRKMILDDDHIDELSSVAHHTNSPIVVLYHVARLIESAEGKYLRDIKEKVRNDLIVFMSESDSELERIMAHAALFRLGEKHNAYIDWGKVQEEISTFNFFIVDSFGVTREAKNLNRLFPTFRWVSEAMNWTLVLEYLVLKEQYHLPETASSR